MEHALVGGARPRFRRPHQGANWADLEALTIRNFDASTFNAWFTAYIGRNERGMRLAAKRFTPQFRTAFNAWWATHPETNPHAPPGPTYMPQYHPAGAAQSRALDTAADAYFATGEHAGLWPTSTSA